MEERITRGGEAVMEGEGGAAGGQTIFSPFVLGGKAPQAGRFQRRLQQKQQMADMKHAYAQNTSNHVWTTLRTVEGYNTV